MLKHLNVKFCTSIVLAFFTSSKVVYRAYVECHMTNPENKAHFIRLSKVTMISIDF